jgi:outer membrane protein assembly factor BamB
MEMVKKMKCRQVLLVGLLVLCAAASGVAAEGGSRWLVSPELLEHAKLELLWQKELPMKETESLSRLFVLGSRVYTLSDLNYMFCLDSKKGNVIFSRPFAPRGFPVLGLELYEDEVVSELISIIGGRLLEINPEFGTEIKATRVGFGVTCPAARNGSNFYLAGADRRMHTLRAEDKVHLFEAAASSDSLITSIVAGDDCVVFGTDAGNVVSVAPDAPKGLWQFDAADGIIGPIVRDGESLFFASKDTNVYRVDIVYRAEASARKLVWKYQAAAVLDKAPRVTPDVVYQYVRYKGLEAIDRKSGKFMWQVPEGVDLLAESGGKAYVIGKKGKLVVMDNKRAKRLYSVNFARVSRYVANVGDSKIYVAGKDGRVACIKPIE